MKYGYVRFSLSQNNTEFSLENQQKLLKKYGCQRIVVDYCETDTIGYPVLESLIQNTIGQGDWIVVTNINRLARNLTDCISIIQYIYNKDACIHVMGSVTLKNDELGNMFLTALKAAINLDSNRRIEYAAEFRQRTYRSRNIGRPRIPHDKMVFALELLKTCTFREVCQVTNISRSSLVRALKRLSVKKKDWK